MRTTAAIVADRVTRRVTLLAAAVLALAPLVASRASAQDTGPTTVTGRVTSEAGAPIANAIVTIRRLRLVATTNDEGRYRLVVPAARSSEGSDTLRVTRLGFGPVDRPLTLAPGRVTIDVTMDAQVVSLEQVVVTGTAGNQERKAQAAVVSTIDAADIVSKAPISTVNELLTARDPGVVLTQSSGTSGANTRIDIRGQASISLSNYPLVFIDGVRMTAGQRPVVQAPGGTTAGAGGQIFNALNDLNPDDIESIEVVKGPAASTLYGADASAGVIQIITKKGRAGARGMTQRLMGQYDDIDPHFTPPTNYAACPASLVGSTSTNPLCRGQAVGAIVSDNPIDRIGAFDNGWTGQLQYSAQGGGDTFGYFGSASALNERGTTRGSFLNHRTGRVNLNWTASDKVAIEALVGMSRSDDRLTQGDQSSYGYLINGGFGSPLSVGALGDGRLTGGLLNNNLSVEAISAILTEDVTLRTTPSLQARYQPFAWFSNRITAGADLLRTNAFQQFPKNDKNWYSAIANTGSIGRNYNNVTVYTVDYLGNINRRFGRDGWISSDLSFGTQWINTVNETLTAAGQGLLVNGNNLIPAATTSAAGEAYAQSKSFGILAQEQIGFHDRIFLQFGAREDRNSAFGSQVGSFFLPKAGISWVLSQEPGFQRITPSLLSTFRIRAAYGQTGRSPSSTAALQTFSRSNYVTDAGVVVAGVSPGSPGNADLEPERGIEIEAGFDAGFFHDRVGLEATYFSKTSRDLLLQSPLAPSSGFSTSPFVNIGQMTNKGLELLLRASAIESRNVTLDATLTLGTLANKVVDMGAVAPIVGGNGQCIKPGIEVAAWCAQRFVGVDPSGTKAIVTDTPVVIGGNLPKTTAGLSTTLTLFRVVRLYAQADGKFGHRIYNLTDDYRERILGNAGKTVLPADQGGYSSAERLRRFGPFINSKGANVGATLVRGDYVQPGDFVRFRELSATLTLPASLSRRVGVSSTSLSIGGRNLALWSRYGGFDPEVIGAIDPITPYLAEVFTTPQTRRLFARVNLQF